MENGNNLMHSFNATEYSQGHFLGLTKREYFAAMAMQGMLANPDGAMMKGGTRTAHPNNISKMSVIHADAVLAELDKPKDE